MVSSLIFAGWLPHLIPLSGICLNGKKLEYPRVAPDITFKKAKRKSKGKELEQGQLNF